MKFDDKNFQNFGETSKGPSSPTSERSCSLTSKGLCRSICEGLSCLLQRNRAGLLQSRGLLQFFHLYQQPDKFFNVTAWYVLLNISHYASAWPPISHSTSQKFLALDGFRLFSSKRKMFSTGNIQRVFGKDMLDYVKMLVHGQIDYFPRLPSKLIVRIAKLLELEDISRLAQVSTKFRQVSVGLSNVIIVLMFNLLPLLELKDISRLAQVSTKFRQVSVGLSNVIIVLMFNLLPLLELEDISWLAQVSTKFRQVSVGLSNVIIVLMFNLLPLLELKDINWLAQVSTKFRQVSVGLSNVIIVLMFNLLPLSLLLLK